VNWTTATLACSDFKFSVGDSLSCRESSSDCRLSGRDKDKTVLSCLAWRCDLASTVQTLPDGLEIQFTPPDTTDSTILSCLAGGVNWALASAPFEDNISMMASTEASLGLQLCPQVELH